MDTNKIEVGSRFMLIENDSVVMLELTKITGTAAIFKTPDTNKEYIINTGEALLKQPDFETYLERL